ncbi:CBS domain-containing protein [uncultured Ferrovibrio sp.]|jgi:CBS domain-containing protein|uniref:CBS domain-containing protein n=1 Tax=uncultured Ferrovibrio sp. TaxID=1576913 RepID=UPI002622D012|nr:CBS domain-containing protein [uncultured Ferrovibrio sp.]
MKAADIMTTHVEVIRADAPVAQAIRIMLQKRISGLPVVDADGNLVGVVTEGDFLRRHEIGTARHRPRWFEVLLSPGHLAQDYVQTHARMVSDVMTRNVVSVDADTDLDDIVRLMEKHEIKRVPVLRDGKLVGIVSRANLLHAFASTLAEAKPAAASDKEIREKLLAELKDKAWAPTGTINIVVRDGVVHLWGTIFDERERQALRVAAENAPGVKAVEDHLIWIEPMSGLHLAADKEPPKAP